MNRSARYTHRCFRIVTRDDDREPVGLCAVLGRYRQIVAALRSLDHLVPNRMKLLSWPTIEKGIASPALTDFHFLIDAIRNTRHVK